MLMKMIFRKSMVIAFLFLSYFANAQTKNGSVTGKIVSVKDKTPIDYASIAVKNLADSSVAGSSNTNTDGSFVISGLAPGSYRLYVAYLGLKSVTKDFLITAAAPKANLGSLAMDNAGLDLKTVEIKGVTPPVVVKTDTVEFNASSFKVRENAVVEDVLKKLPGVEVAKDGSVKAQGETVTRIKVDGKTFFGNDPLLATKNLPADMIDKIQVIDQMSDQAQFTGVDDGSREKIINITTKKDKKNGFFGNSSAGYGTDDRYDVNLNVNRFKGEQQMSVIAQFNNVNKQSFGAGNSAGGSGGGAGGGRRQMSLGNNSASPQGITTTNAVGFNFADIYTDKTQISGSYFFNKTSLLNIQNTLRQNLLGDVTTTFQDALNSTTEKTNHRFNFLIDTKIDSLTSIRIEPDISYTESDLNQSDVFSNRYANNSAAGIQSYKLKSTAPTINNNILLRKKFLRRGRTISLNVNTSINDTDSKNYNDIITNTTDSLDLITTTAIDQLNDQSGHSISNTSRLVYTEPLSKTLNLEFNYQNRYNFDNSDRFTYNFNPVTSKYDIVDLDYTNSFENTTLTNALGVSLSKNEKKYNWNIGLAVQNTDRKNDNLTTGNVINQNFYNIVPSAQFRYTFSTSKRLRINYRGNTQQPSISQIQPIPDNTNTQSVPLGNPGLKPSFTNNLNVFYNNFDFAHFRSLFIFGNFSQTFNSFGNSSSIITDKNDPNVGKIAVLPINVDGIYSANVGSAVGLPIITENKLNLNISLNGGYSRGVNVTNAIENVTNNLSVTNGYKLVSSFDKFDFTAGINGTLNRATYSAQPSQNTTYYTLNPTLDISYVFPWNIRLAADVDYFQNTGRGAGYDINYTILNSYISKQFFKNRGTFKLAVSDALNQNQGVTRTSVNNTITDINYNVLKRYYMLSFTYSLNKMGGRTMSPQMDGPGGRQGGGMRMRM
jgi:hypothetical protein